MQSQTRELGQSLSISGSPSLESHSAFSVLVVDLVLVIRSRVAAGRLTGRADEELAVWWLLY